MCLRVNGPVHIGNTGRWKDGMRSCTYPYTELSPSDEPEADQHQHTGKDG
jgi:hypothetical protein